MRDHITLDEVLAIEDPTEKHDALVDWVIKLTGYPYEIGEEFNAKALAGSKSAKTPVKIAEGAIYHPDNHTGLFGPRIIFHTMVSQGIKPYKRGEWYFRLIFQFDKGTPRDFSSDWSFTLKQIEDGAEQIKWFMETGQEVPVKDAKKQTA